MPLEVIREPRAVQQRMIELHRAGRSICVVPTMGALHEGHRTLIERGRREGDVLVVTIFVNPKQFGPGEDLDRYPRTFDADRAMCEAEGADFIFLPTNAMMYPPGYATHVGVEGLTERLCGASRPNFFGGVTTVVTKLLLITQADKAIFGWKDAQQQLVVRRMVRDLNIPCEIVGVETVRDPDGLAASSRNAYLCDEDRHDALVLHRALTEARRRVEDEGLRDAAALRQGIVDMIGRESRGRIDYVDVVSMEDVQPVDKVEPGATLVAVAVWWGETRLIDNARL